MLDKKKKSGRIKIKKVLDLKEDSYSFFFDHLPDERPRREWDLHGREQGVSLRYLSEEKMGASIWVSSNHVALLIKNKIQNILF